ncbi:MAG: type II toxin-antitoxin system RelE/ParE family toxin [Prevotellaceae bacterium]|nr:type II toxin-antitoxin system RelE/ParE family toxin [Prevotellaceae bacterium]
MVNEKFVKKFINTELYELRISLEANEHRTILIAVDNANFMQAKRIVLLNSFLKKDTKQYKREIEKAIKIIQTLVKD